MNEIVKVTLDGLLDSTLEEIEKNAFDAAIIRQDEQHRFVSDAEKITWDGKANTSIATSNAHGLMSSGDKVKLDGIAKFANYYTHPSSHPGSIITEDATHRFVTDTEKSNWNTKAGSVIPVTTTINGLMLAEDKAKLDGIAVGATNYTHPVSHAASMITEDASHRFVTDGERNKLLGIEANANNYIHPINHNATIITQDSTHRFMTDSEKTKLNGIEVGANNYIHPTAHLATVITQDANNRFVTDIQIATWADKYTKSEVDNKLSAYTIGLDWKEAVATFADIATTYPTPADGWTVNVKDTDITYKYTGAIWIAISANSIPLATTALDGKMSKVDKAKLDNIAANANNYVHPGTHSPSIILQDTNNRFVTDGEKSTWNAKANATHNHSSISISDTRSTTMSVGDYKSQFAVDFKQTSKIGSPDNGIYSGVCTIAPWVDSSGGGNHQLAFTDNGNVYHRYGTSTGWGAWDKLAKMADVDAVAEAAATLSGHTINDFVLKEGSTMIGALSVPTLKITGGEGWAFKTEGNYFGTNLDARIIELTDTNSTNGNVDGGLAIVAYTSIDDKRIELMRIRNSELKYKNYNIYHQGNFDITSKADKIHTHTGSEISGTVPSASVAFSIPESDVGGNIWID